MTRQEITERRRAKLLAQCDAERERFMAEPIRAMGEIREGDDTERGGKGTTASGLTFRWERL